MGDAALRLLRALTVVAPCPAGAGTVLCSAGLDPTMTRRASRTGDDTLGQQANGLHVMPVYLFCVELTAGHLVAVSRKHVLHCLRWPWSPWLVYGSLHAGFRILPCTKQTESRSNTNAAESLLVHGTTCSPSSLCPRATRWCASCNGAAFPRCVCARPYAQVLSLQAA